MGVKTKGRIVLPPPPRVFIMQITSFYGRREEMERAHVTDYLIRADPQFPDWEIMFWGEVEIALKSGIELGFVSWASSTSHAILGLRFFSFNSSLLSPSVSKSCPSCFNLKTHCV